MASIRCLVLDSMAAAALAAMLFLPACAVNPATGKRQISLIGTEQEIEIGRQQDAQIVAALGVYEHAGLQDYVQRVGERLAAESERPDLPWTFRVVDDPSVNAFALPGGFIYLTRGILAHLNSEAEMAAVLGHEIGHVTARHSVNQMSKAQLVGLGLGVGAAVSEEFRDISGLAQTGLQLLFLKYSRDDERQADELGLRYVTREGYDPREMLEVFRMLDRQYQAADGGRVPGWLATHPAPSGREQDIQARIEERQLTGTTVRGAVYYRNIDGMVFGRDPRQGFFRETRFMHPELRFRIDFPSGFDTQNQRQAVFGVSPQGDAVVQLSLSESASADTALAEFFRRSGATEESPWVERINGLPAASRNFTATADGSELRGLVACVGYGGRVYQLLGYASAASWRNHDEAIARSLSSFDRLTDPSALDVRPDRLQVVDLQQSLSLSAFASQYDASVDVETLAVINHLVAGARLEAGQSYKVVKEGPA